MRRSLLSLAALLAIVFVAIALLPFWLGWGLAQFGPRFGIRVESYTRIGYRQFEVQGVEYRRAPVRVTIDRVRATTPVIWLAQHWFGTPDRVVAGRWTTEVTPAAKKRSDAPRLGWTRLRDQLARIADRLDYWVPAADLGPGTVTWNQGGLSFTSARWENRTIRTQDIGYRALHANVVAQFSPNGDIDVTAVDERNALTLRAVSRGAEISGEASWAGQPASVTARFRPNGWLPERAELKAEKWTLPGERLKLQRHYARVTADGVVRWSDAGLYAEVSADSVPLEGDPAPRLSVRVRGQSRGAEFVAEQFRVRLPGATAELTEPVVIDRKFRLTSAPSRFTLSAQLAELPWFEAQGALRGEGRIGPGRTGVASLQFSATGEGLVLAGTKVERVSASGLFEWPTLSLRAVRIRADERNELRGEGGWDFAKREVLPTKAEGATTHGFVQRWVRKVPAFNAATFSVSAGGVWPEVRHEGRVHVEEFEQAPLRSMTLDAEWSGSGTAAQRVVARGTTAEASIDANGSADLRAAHIAEAVIAPRGKAELRSVQPFVVEWRPSVKVGPAQFQGREQQVQATLNWAKQGGLDVAAQHLESEWLRSFLTLPSTVWTANTLQLQADWDGGPAKYRGSATFSVPLGENRSAQTEVQLEGDRGGLRIGALRVAEGANPIVTATGQIPIAFQPGQQPFLLVDDEGAFALDATTTANPSFWAQLTALTGVEITEPEAEVHLSGTFGRPRGEAAFRAAQLAARPGRFDWEWPKIERVDVRLAGDRDGVRLNAFSVLIDGQTLRAQGWVPVAASKWAEFVRDPRTLAEHGELRVELPDADIAAIARYVPAYLAPAGRLQIDLTLHSDQTMEGFIRIRNAASRPLGPLGVLQDVEADIRFEGRSVRLEQVTARMGGQAVALRGRADLPAYEPPKFDFTLRGENLPFVRRTGLLVRGDLDLTLKTRDDGQNEIGGKVRLRDSLFVADVRALLPTGAKGGPVRPPYFAIETEPLNSWRLAVEVEGDHFMRLRTPVFNGTASARVRLDGILSNPRATGQATIDDGIVRLPFANFEVRQGEVRLTPEQSEPQLMVIGNTRRYGYDLRLELTGNASSPNLSFSSSPPLEAEQVLLMVMAGQAPNNEITTTDRQRMARFGAFFGQSLLGTLGGDSSGADRLTISSGENISAQGRETYSIEYKLNERWALTGEYDEFDEYYGGVKWRIYQKGGKSREQR